MEKKLEAFTQDLLKIPTVKIFAPTHRYVNHSVMMDIEALHDYIVEKGSSKYPDNSVAEEQFNRILDALERHGYDTHMSDQGEAFHKELKTILNYNPDYNGG